MSQWSPNKMQQTEELRACRACLATDCELHELEENRLTEIFQEITSLKVQTIDAKPKHICSFCRNLLLKAHQFRVKCLKTDQIMLQHAGDLNYIRNINEANMMPILSISEILIYACGGENEFSKDIYPTALSLDSNNLTAVEYDVALKEEPVEIDHLQHVDHYNVDEPVDAVENKYNIDEFSKNESLSSNIPIDGRRDVNELVMVVDPSIVIKEEPKNELEENCIESSKVEEDVSAIYVHDIHESFNEETVDYSPGEYLEEIDEDVNEPNSNISNMSQSIEITISKRNTIKGRVRHVPLSTLEGFLTKLEGKTKTSAMVNRICFYRHILDKYYKKAKRNEVADLWDADNVVLDNVVKQHEVVNSSSNYNLKLFYGFLKQKYRQTEDIINQSAITNNSKMILDLYTHTDVTSEEAQVFEQKYQMKVKCFKSKEDKICSFESQKNRASYLNMKYKCDICYVGYQRKDLYTRHMLVHDPSSGPYECEVCYRRYGTRRRLTKHILSHKYHYTCLVPECDATFLDTHLAKRHSECHKGTTYPCQHCGKVFLKYKSRTQHQQLHATVTCLLCHWRVSGVQALVLHRKKMHPEVFPCAGCGTEFASAAALATHAPRCGGAGESAAACGACGETCPTAEELQRHIETHRVGQRGTKTLHPNKAQTSRRSCLPDSKKDNSKGGVRKRRAKTDGLNICTTKKYKYSKKDFMCEICSKTFSFPVLLREHMMVHTGEKPHGCPDCPKRFRTKLSLQNHTASAHSEVRPYRCEQCGKAFKLPSNFQRHQRNVHTDERRFSCDVCSKMFQEKHNLKMHIKTSHMNVPWPRRAKIGKRQSKE